MSRASFVEGGVESGLHLGFIVDGNRRWAKERGLPTLEGHRKGLSKIEEAIEFYAKSGEVGYLSFFVFSTENWGRSEEEVAYLMKLLGDKIEKLAKKARKEGLRLMIMGSEERVEEGLMRKLRAAEELTADETGMRIILCFNYGGQQEIVEAARKLCLKKINECNGLKGADLEAELAKVGVEEFSENLYCPEVPEADMIVRTSGEERISGFLLWRAAYAEFLFLKKYFPEMGVDDFAGVLEEYKKRGRRFGK